MKIRSGFVSNSSSSSFIIATKDKSNPKFYFNDVDFKNFLMEQLEYEEEGAINFINDDDLSHYFKNGYGLTVINVDNNFYDYIDDLVELFGGKVVKSFM